MTLGIQDIVEVRAQITPRGAGGREFGRTLLFTTDPTLDAGAGRVRVFASMDEVARTFAADSGPYQAAQVYFSQVPYPRNLVIGRWINTRESARLTGGIPRALEQITGSPTVVRGSGIVASLDTFHGRATVLTGAGMVSDLVNFYGRATVLTGAGTVADLVNFHGRATVLTGAGTVADLVNFHGRATVLTGAGTVADLVNFHGRATVLTGTGTVADLVNFHGRSTVLTGTGTVADLVNFHGRSTVLTGTGTVADLVNFYGRATVLTGTGTVASLTTLQGITSGTVTFLGQTVTGLDFSSDTDLDGVASTLQAALRATSATSLDEVEVAYDSTASAFVVTLPLDSSTGVVPTASAAFTGDDADELGLDTATIVNGVDAIVSGTVTFLSQSLTGLDFSAVTDYDDVASVLQTALRATSSTDLDNVEVAYDSTASAFVVTLPLDSSTGVVPTASAAFTGTESDELGLDTATIVNGVDAIVSGTVTFLSQSLTGLDFSAVTDYDDVASVLQTALRATSSTDLDNVEVDYDGSLFVVTLPLDSSGVVPTASAAFTGDDADELGLDTATIINGVDAIKSGTVTFLSQTLTGLDFSSVTDYDDVASTLQAALRATSSTDLDNVEVAYDSTASAFVVTLPLDSSTGVVPTASAAFTGTESDELGLDTATIVNGVDAIVSGTVTFLSQSLTELDFSAVTDYDDVASVLQTALRATSSTDLDNVEVDYDGSLFVVTLPLDSSGVVPTASAAFTGDDADELGLDTATIVNGVDAIVSGTVTFLSQSLTGLDFSAVTDYDDVASVLQDALRAASVTALASVEVAYQGGVFVVIIPLDSQGAATSVSGAFTGDNADELGLDTATIVDGVSSIQSGTVTFLSQTLTGLDFSAVTDYDGVASALQTALRATSATSLDEVEVAYDSDASVFVVTIPLDSNGAATSVSAAFTGSESDELGLDTATIVDGVSAIQSGSVTLLDETFSGLDFSSVTDYDDVASVLQTALRGATGTTLDDVEVAYDSDASAFVVTIPLAADGSATAVTAAFTGATADEVGLDTVTIEDGIDTITVGSVTFHGASLTGLDLSSVAGYDDVAAVVQNALRGSSVATLDAVEVEHDGSQFVLTLPLGLDGSATEVTEAFTGDTADELGLDTVDITAGVDGIGAGSLTWHGSSISVDFTGAVSYDDVASTLQTALRAVRAAARADLRSATVEFDPVGFFRVRLGFDSTSGDPYAINGFMADDAQEPASALGLDSTSGGGIVRGQASEPIEDAMDAISGLDDGWYFVTVDSSITASADLLSLSRWVQAKAHMLALDVVDEGVLTPNESTSLAAQLSALEQQRTFLVWSRTRDGKALSLAGRLSSVNFDGQNALITPKFKSLPGTTPDIVTTAQKEELDRKWVGYYTRFGPDAIFAEGWTQAGDWIDVRYWLDWITKAIQTEVYNLLRQHPTRVPQTAEGLASIEAAIERVCEAGRRNGGIAPGRVSEAVANDIRLASNNPAFEGFLPTGYLVVIGSIADQLQIDRDARRSPTIRVWLKGSGAMHHVTIGLVFTG